MVVFTCDACGESLKKNQVEKHYLQKCRNCNILTCVDCLKDFPGDSYQEHTKCITEEERYSAKGWQPKANANKNAKKQEAWVDNIRNILSDRCRDLDPDVKNLLNTIVGFDNIPRKRAKFVNFIQNAVGRRTPGATIDKTWDVFEEALKGKSAASVEPEMTRETNEENMEVETDRKSKKKKNKNSDVEPVDGESMNVESDAEPEKKKKNKKKDRTSETEETKESNSDVTKNKKKRKQDEEEQESTSIDQDDSTTVEPNDQELFNKGVQMFPGTKSFQNRNCSNGKTAKTDFPMETEQSNGKASKSGKRKLEEEHDDDQDSKKSKIEEPAGHPQNFNWEFAIRSLLMKKGSMKVKRLKKKIVDEYVTAHGETVKSRVQLESKLEKKLKKNKEFKYTNDTVTLASSRDDD